MPFDENLAARIRHAVRDRTDITERRMFGGLSFLRHGKMCCGIVGQDLVVRVLDEDGPSVLRRAHVRPMDFTGKPLRGFVYVAPPGVATEDQLLDWIRRGLAFTEPKASLRRRRRR
jgi:TfoX/Sxy family transcriptional regulator of competence genes